VVLADVVVAVVRNENNAAAGLSTTAIGKLYRDPNARFADRFPTPPRFVDEPESAGGVQIQLHLAISSHCVAEEEDLSAPVLTGLDRVTAVSAAMRGIAAGSGFTLEQSHVTLFRGHLAAFGTFKTPAGQEYDGLAFVNDSSRMYLVGAERSLFPSLVSGLVVLDGPAPPSGAGNAA
jgi:hypothetical protein